MIRNSWLTLMAYFGGKPFPSKIEKYHSYKFFIVTFLFLCVLVWMCYRAMLSAKFAVTVKSYPFEDLESLSNTEYILYTADKTTSTYPVLQSWPYKKVWENNIKDDKSFNSNLDLQIETTLTKPYSAFFYMDYVVLNMAKYDVQLFLTPFFG